LKEAEQITQFTAGDSTGLFVSDDCVYFTTPGNHLMKVSINSHMYWQIGYSRMAPGDAPFVHNGSVYFREAGALNILKVSINSPYQSIKITNVQARSAPFISGDYCYFQSSYDDELWKVAINQANPPTPSSLGVRTKSTPFVINTFIVFQGMDDKLWRISDCGGVFKTAPSYAKAPPSVDNDAIYFQSNTDKLMKLDKRALFPAKLLGNVEIKSSPVLSEGYVYFQSNNNGLYKIPVDGSTSAVQLKSYTTNCAPFVDRRVIYFCHSSDNNIWKVPLNALDNGTNLNRKSKSTPFVTNDHIYYRGMDDELFRMTTNGTDLQTLSPPKMSTNPFVYQGNVYYGTLSPENKLWSVPTEGPQGHAFRFATCHSNVGSLWNQYQSLDSLLRECRDFLDKNPSETIVMKVKIGDPNGNEGKEAAFHKALNDVLVSFPYSNPLRTIPTLKDLRGRFYYLNNVGSELHFGPYLNWQDNQNVIQYVQLWEYGQQFTAVNVQDHYQFGWLKPRGNVIDEKKKEFLDIIPTKRETNIVINFGSANYDLIFEVPVTDHILEEIGRNDSLSRNTNLGWMYWDYAFSSFTFSNYPSKISVVDFIIDSNFNFTRFPRPLGLLGVHH
jgi:hypothetical protein